jgi:hypothetical protein
MKILLLFAITFILSSKLFALPEYTYRIPNSYKNLCSNCHLQDDSSDNKRNPFGLDFAANGKKWSTVLAKLDSDGDGFTNGQELEDPLGIWNGDTLGMSPTVTRPGDPNSRPTSINLADIPIFEIAPNPAKENINLRFSISQRESFELSIIDINGVVVNRISVSNNKGDFQNYNLVLKDENNAPLASGLYFIQIAASNFINRKSFIVVQ